MVAKIFVCQPIPEVALDRMREYAEVEVFPFSHRAISVGELESAARRSDYIFCMHETPVTASIVAANPNLKGFGLGHAEPEIVDIAACEAAGIKLLEAGRMRMTEEERSRFGHATSDLMVALLLNLAYRVTEADRYCRRLGYFQEMTMDLMGVGCAGKTISLIGLGRVARGAVPTLRALGLEVLYTKRTRLDKDEEDRLEINWVEDRDELISRGDFVSMLVNYEPANHKLMGEREFALMKPTAYFINVGRGRLVDEEAMIRALENGVIAGAGLDVYYSEPPTNVDPYIPLALRRMENVVLTPHNGGATWASRSRATLRIADAIVADIVARSTEAGTSTSM
jgi:glyoxylate reductase